MSQLHADLENVYNEAMTILRNESAWTKHTFARSAIGSVCSATSPDAVCWCLMGALGLAIYRICPEWDRDNGTILVNFITNEFNEMVSEKGIIRSKGGMVGFQDHETTTHQEILDLLQRAKDAAHKVYMDHVHVDLDERGQGDPPAQGKGRKRKTMTENHWEKVFSEVCSCGHTRGNHWWRKEGTMECGVDECTCPLFKKEEPIPTNSSLGG